MGIKAEDNESESEEDLAGRENWGVVIALGQSFGADFHWCTSFPSHAVVLDLGIFYLVLMLWKIIVIITRYRV